MRSVLALLRATWLSATSYRIATLLSFVSLLASIVPVFFMAKAVEPLARASIRLEGNDYFGFVVIGIAMSYVLAAATTALPAALTNNIGSGTFEALMVTRTPLPLVLLGLVAYPLLLSLVNAGLVVAGAVVLGVRPDPRMLPAVLGIVGLLVAAQMAFGLVAASLVLLFRTSGPLLTAVVTGSNLLGGVFYSTSAIPGWLQSLSWLFPLTYALRAARRLLLAGASFADVAGDVGALALLAAAGLAAAGTAFALALRHARRAGTLTHL
ncbi:MAG: ABC transporter permease [Gemmatimonadaceae bacterium]|nr:ABC transporter permease [Gemmatimonadaceae bacterium]